MAQGTFENTVLIQAEPERAARILSALDHHTALHPFIVAVREVASAPGDAPGSRRYRITDRMKVGPVALRFTYSAVLSFDPETGTISSEAFQFPAIHLKNTTRCRAEGTGTRVEEQVVVNAPRPLLGYVLEQARSAHRQMLQALKAMLERGG